ncbi:hypothetical protein BC938DRAFT_476485 [Jimgerdemannia flammicorona]|uniref:Uncharacterized protein n=1 Tax=Jimgerdemannia flammicorona TaxID=994334 RepID=A0A433QQI7_9FUNG|nr:hypothetical protein BC938DRAFT_476485 [Jimgerdemannia flammicorona]
MRKFTKALKKRLAIALGHGSKQQQLLRLCEQPHGQLPPVLQDETVAGLALDAVKNNGFPDDPAIAIAWNPAGFNDVPATPGCRNGVPGQTLAALVAYFVASGGVDAHNLNILFMFRTPEMLSICEQGIPNWARHQAGVPDVCFSAIRINHMTYAGQLGFEVFGYAFNENR